MIGSLKPDAPRKAEWHKHSCLCAFGFFICRSCGAAMTTEKRAKAHSQEWLCC
jgi:hypothetical protein